MLRILQAKKQVNIEVIGENMFLLEFASDIDRRRTLMDGPWNFFKDLVISKIMQTWCLRKFLYGFNATMFL